MAVKTLLRLFLCAVCIAWSGARTWADDSALAEMDPDVAKKFGGMIAEQFMKEHKNLQAKVDPDAEKAVGLFNGTTNEGILLVPLKGFREENEAPKGAEGDRGVGLCYVFMSPSFNPLVDGKPIDSKKLRKVKIKDDDGNEREVTCLVCSVKHAEGDEYQLLVFGADKEPLVKSNFEEASDAPKADLALTVKDVKDTKATLVINFFGKYCTTIPIGYKK